MRHVEEPQGLVAEKSVEEEAARVPHLDVQVLLHELEVAGLESALNLGLKRLLAARVQVAQLVGELGDALAARREVRV